MLDVNLIRKEPETVKKGIAAKGADPKLVDRFLKLDEEWRALTTEIDGLRNEQKKLGAEKKVKEASKIKEKIKAKESRLAEAEKEREAVLLQIPNVPLPSVPVGKSEADNKMLREIGNKPKFSFPAKDYLTLAHNLDLIDTERAAKVSGSRFGYLKNEAVLLEFALVDLAIKTLVKEKFIPIVPPVLVRPEVMHGMGKVKFVEDKDAFHIPEDNLYLVGSSEHSVGPYHMDEVLDQGELPKRYAAFSTCFRREAGSYGKDTKGIIRVHQFDKVEMMAFVRPEESEKEHKFLLSLQEKMMQELELPYRVVEVASGEMGFADARQYDIETWLPGEGKYRETHSASNTTDFQARGINVKYRRRDGLPAGQAGKTEFLHMLNATAFAIGRTLIAIFENYQTLDGKIKIPKVLQKYVGQESIS
ncbi:MAG: serine--tRNA ligase [Candidatus Liptonbacteria bacterium]|nr:serine--tRNA ligase [Candidatus Liptonbacteria bacterium]